MITTERRSILITGSSGFLGSQLAFNLAEQGHIVYAVDSRVPASNFQKILKSFPNIIYIKSDVSNYVQFSESIKDVEIDFIYHFAAVWGYGQLGDEIYERINVQGTRNILQLAIVHSVKRIFFASSLAVFNPSKQGAVITEQSPIDDYTMHPYGKSKACSEREIKLFCDTNPSGPDVTVVRLAGIFSDWCELPPLAWMIARWDTIGPMGRIIAGAGNTGMPYLHRDDFTALMIKCMEAHQKMKHCETLIASPSRVTTHNDMFPVIRRVLGRSGSPIYIPRSIVKIGMYAERIARMLVRLQPPPEEPWMLAFLDKPICSDSSITQEKLGWKPTPSLSIENCLEDITKLSLTQKEKWNAIHLARDSGQIKAAGFKSSISPNPTLSMSKISEFTTARTGSMQTRMFHQLACSIKVCHQKKTALKKLSPPILPVHVSNNSKLRFFSKPTGSYLVSDLLVRNLPRIVHFLKK